jgi:predicted membrane protein DUF2339
VLYAVTFACRAYYHFAFFGLIPTFLLMTLITAIAFLLAVRLNAMVVAVLGIAGGFLTPVLLSTGEDYPFGLFAYIALLDVGLLAVAQRQRWNALPILGAVGTALMQFAWITTFFVPEEYFAGNKVLVVMAVFAGFQGLFLAAAAWAKRTAKTNRELLACALGLAGAAILSAFYLLSFPTIAHRPTLLFSYVFIVHLGVLALTLLESRLTIVNALAGLAAFILLATWTNSYLTTAYLYTALTFYFIFALFHSATPLVLQRLCKIHVPWWSQAFPALSLVLMLMPIFQIAELSIVVWPFVLIVDLLAFGLALATGTLLPILAMLLLTLVAIGGWLLRIPSELTGLPTALFTLGGFAIFFLVAASWTCRRFLKTGTRAKTLRRHLRSGKSFGSASRVVGHDALSAVNHGNAAVATWESIRGVRRWAVASRFASRHERNALARRAAGGGALLRARIGIRVAFPTFRSGSRGDAVDLVSRILRGVQHLSFHFPSKIC